MGIIDSVRSAAKSFGEKMGGLSAASEKLNSLGKIISEHKMTNDIKAFAAESYKKWGRDSAIKNMDELTSAIKEKGEDVINLTVHGRTREQMENETQNNEVKKPDNDMEIE